MSDIITKAHELLIEVDLCLSARPKHNAVDVQLEKDSCLKFANHLKSQISWGSENDIYEAYYKLESKVYRLRNKLIFEVLKHGSL